MLSGSTLLESPSPPPKLAVLLTTVVNSRRSGKRLLLKIVLFSATIPVTEMDASSGSISGGSNRFSPSSDPQ